MSVGTERRRHARVDILVEVHITHDAEVHIFRAANASLGGLFLQGPLREYPAIRVGADVEVILFAAEPGEMEDVAARGRVVRIDPHGYAVEFTALDDKNRARLATLLARAADR